MIEIKNGDRVVVNGSIAGKQFVNERGVVVAYETDDRPLVSFDTWRGGHGRDWAEWYCDADKITKEEATMTKTTFKPGDKVRVKCTNTHYSGRTGTFVEDDGDPPLPLHVELDGGDIGYFDPEDIELVSEVAPRFIIGWMTDASTPEFAAQVSSESFATREEADKTAIETLRSIPGVATIGVFELRGTHKASFEIKSEEV